MRHVWEILPLTAGPYQSQQNQASFEWPRVYQKGKRQTQKERIYFVLFFS